MRDIIKGDDEDIVILLRKANGKARKLDGTVGTVERIKACFPKQTGTAPLNVYHLPLEADTTSGSDIVAGLASTSLISEGMPVSGPGIPAGATVLKTPASTVSPTAAGTVQISANATATATDVDLVFGHIEITSGAEGEITIHLHEAETSVLKASLVGTTSTPMSFEVETVISGVTKTAQFPKALNVIARTC